MSNRYEHLHYCEYRDTETGLIASNYVDVMNEQDQKIKDQQITDLEVKVGKRDIALSKMERKMGRLEQKAIAELEKVRDCFGDYLKGLLWNDTMLVGKVCNMINETIDQQIAELKGEV